MPLTRFASPAVLPDARTFAQRQRSELSTLLVCRRRGVRGSGLLLDDVSNRAVALQPALVHPGQHQYVVVHIIVDLHESLVVMETMQPPHILLQRALPGDWHRQE